MKIHVGVEIEYTVAQFIEALRYKPEGCRFDSRWHHSNSTVALGSTQSLTKMSTGNGG
jgi:hypothetical protein